MCFSGQCTDSWLTENGTFEVLNVSWSQARAPPPHRTRKLHTEGPRQKSAGTAQLRLLLSPRSPSQAQGKGPIGVRSGRQRGKDEGWTGMDRSALSSRARTERGLRGAQQQGTKFCFR